MIRVVVYLVIVGALAAGAAWIADRPGEVAVTWQGLRVETSVMVAMVALIALVVLAIALWSLLRLVLNSPRLMARSWRARRGARGFHALSGGLVAVGAGDAEAARRFADEARRIAPKEPLTLLLTAQVAQMSGDGAEAERTFRAMAARDETKLLGLHGLFVEARRRGDAAAARLLAEEAAQTSPALDWAGRAVLEFRSLAADWTGALEGLERNHRHGLIDKAAYRRQRAVLLTARAIALDEGHVEGDRGTARAAVLEAVKLAPDLPPAAALAGRLLGESNELRKGARLLEAAWKAHPHPDIAVAYAHLRFGDSAQDRLARVKALVRRTPGHAEGALALARAALEAQDFRLAREALAPLLATPTRRAALMMAELERAEHGDEGRAREWTARAAYAAPDPAWTADGVVSERWLPVSPVTGQIDAFRWRVPVTELDIVRPVVDLAERPADGTLPAVAAAAPADAQPDLPPAAAAAATEGSGRAPAGEASQEPAPATAATPAAGDAVPESAGALPAQESSREPSPASGPATAGVEAGTRLETAAGAAPPAGRNQSAGGEPAAPKPAATVIPLMRAPDDPGPDADPLSTDDQSRGPRRVPF